MKNIMKNIGMLCVVLVLIAGFLTLIIDLLLVVVRLLVLIPTSPELGSGGPVTMWLSLAGAAFAGIFVLVIGLGIAISAARKRTASREEYRRAAIVWLALFIAGLLAWLLPAIPTNVPQISLSPTGAHPAFMEFGENYTIRFANISSTQRQILCIGSQTTCQVVDGAPTELAPPGLTLQPGQSIEVTFPTSGDFHLISPTTPGLSLEILVDAPDPNSFSQCDVMQCW